MKNTVKISVIESINITVIPQITFLQIPQNTILLYIYNIPWYQLKYIV